MLRVKLFKIVYRFYVCRTPWAHCNITSQIGFSNYEEKEEATTMENSYLNYGERSEVNFVIYDN